jgi:hypothetical protein
MPETAPPSVASLPLVSTVPPPALSVTARFEVKPDRNCKVPPPKMRPPALLPRLLSADTASVPAVMVVGPLYVFAALSTKVPAPIFSIGRGPLSSEITPACVAAPSNTWNCVVLLLTMIEFAIVTPLA